jgi:hypothetical protein
MKSCISDKSSKNLVDQSGTENRTIGKVFALSGTGSIDIDVNEYKNLIIDYVITVGDDRRTGTLTSSGNGTAYSFQDEYVESSDVGVDLYINSSSGELQYSTATAAEILYTIKFFQ